MINPFLITEKTLIGPNLINILGTDHLGRDIFSRLLVAIFASVLIAFVSILIATIIGVIIGGISGYYAGLVDIIVQTIVDMILSIPSILIAIAIVVLLKSSIFSVILAIILIYLPLIVNHTRALFRKEKEKEYIIANKTYGASNFRIMTKHIYSNIKKYIYLNFSLNFSKAILTEASLGFLGIGIDPSIPTLGNMLNDSKAYFLTNPIFTISPGIVIIVIVYIANLNKKELDDVNRNREFKHRNR